MIIAVWLSVSLSAIDQSWVYSVALLPFPLSDYTSRKKPKGQRVSVREVCHKLMCVFPERGFLFRGCSSSVSSVTICQSRGFLWSSQCTQKSISISLTPEARAVKMLQNCDVCRLVWGTKENVFWHLLFSSLHIWPQDFISPDSSVGFKGVTWWVKGCVKTSWLWQHFF